jgi:hypothetical protein
MISLAISILWFALGVLILGAIVWVALWAVKQFLPVPAVVEKVVWAAFLILVLIYLLMAIQGGGHVPFRIGLSGPAGAATGTADL